MGVPANSAAADYARNQGAVLQEFPVLEQALEALQEERVEAVIHDAPILKYRIRQSFEELGVTDRILVRDDYAFAFTQGNPLREEVNHALLAILHTPVWQPIKRRYLGEEDPL